MGLIDAYKAIKSIDEIVCSMSVCINSDYCHGMTAMKDAAIHAIEKQPTVDAVPVGFIEALHTYYVRRSKALQGRIGHMYTLYALALEKLVQSFNYVNAMDDEMKTERNCADGERR